jgi:hypothetical protein
MRRAQHRSFLFVTWVISHLKVGKEGASSQLHTTSPLAAAFAFTKLRFHRMTFVFQTPFLIFAKGADRGYS